MKQLHDKVNIVPVIGKADTLTPTELDSMKRRVSYFITQCQVLNGLQSLFILWDSTQKSSVGN